MNYFRAFVSLYAYTLTCVHMCAYMCERVCNANSNAYPLCEIIEVHNQDPLLSISQTRIGSVNAADELDGWADCENDTASRKKIDRINDAFIIEIVVGKSCRIKLMPVPE